MNRGVCLTLASAFFAALFLIPYKLAGALGDRSSVVLATLGCAAVLNSVLAIATRGRSSMVPPPRFDRVAWGVSLVLGLCTLVGNWAVAGALPRIDAGMTAALQQTQVLWVALFALAILGEAITTRFVAGMALALGGFAWMSWPTGDARIDMTGALLAVTSALCFGFMHALTRKVIRRIRPVPVNAVRLWVSVLPLLLWPGGLEGLLALPAAAWGFAFLAATSGPFLSRIALMHAVRTLGASRSALVALVTPLFAFLLGWLFFRTVPATRELIGAVVIVTGVALPLFERQNEPPH